MELNAEKMIAKARKLALSAKPGQCKINGKLYTFEFDQKEWFYKVYEDGFLLVRFNTKRLSMAKKFLREWLEN